MYGSAEQDVMGSYKHSLMENQKLFTAHTAPLRLKLLLTLAIVIVIISLTVASHQVHIITTYDVRLVLEVLFQRYCFCPAGC